MATKQINSVGYGISDALINIFPSPIQSQRAPSNTDRGEVGQLWVDIPNNDAYIVTSVVAGVTTWQGIGGGAGAFNALVVNNNITSTNGNIISGGTITAATNIVSTAGTISTTAGAISASTTMTAGTGITATTGNITATTGNLVSTAGAVSAATTVTAGTGITATTGNITATTGAFVINGAEGVGITLGGAVRVIAGTGSPNGVVNASQGSLYLRKDGAGVGDRAYINTDGVTAWTAITTVA